MLPWSGYLRHTSSNLKDITGFIHGLDPDIVGLVEVDAGSFRSGHQHQAQIIAERLGHYHTYSSKYARSSAARLMPMMNKQGNAFLSRDTIHNERFHYFDRGMKRLVIELELDNLVVFLVHLALGFRIRHHQLSSLYDLVNQTDKPHIVAGDFNAAWGNREINLFLAATGLRNADLASRPTYPSWAPRRQLDFILHSPEITTRRLDIPPVTYSDHLPMVYDFDVRT